MEKEKAGCREVNNMKSMTLFFSLLTLLLSTWASPARSGNHLSPEQEQQAMRVITDFLLSTGSIPAGNSPVTPSPGNGTLPPPISNNELISTVKGITISVAGPGSTQILVRTAEGNLLFNLTKIGAAGTPLKADATEWSCLRENNTGLVWEIKTNDGGLHNQNDSFAWYNTDTAANVGSSGFSDNSGATCTGYVAGNPATYCNTQAFVTRVNSQSLCGAQNWRMPTITELKKITSLNKSAPPLYATLFPQGPKNAVWSATPFPGYPKFAWHIYTNDGYAHGTDQSGNLPVLLVRQEHP